MARIGGLHHITAIAGDPQENLDFYAGTLGMRLVKKSVNQDDPGTYHFFFADGAGTPGTDLTFFPWTRLAPGREGAGLTVEVPLAVPADSLAFWSARLEERGVPLGGVRERFGEAALPFRDPHGLALSLVATADDREFVPWRNGPVPAEHQIRGLHAANLTESDLAATAEFLTKVLGFRHTRTEGDWHRFEVAGGGSGAIADVQERPGTPRGRWGTGAVHHVAWRVADDESQVAMRGRLARAGGTPTEVIDRFWFKSVYCSEPGGVLFELATDGPGFAVDEAPEALGTKLILPPWLEPQRREIEGMLPQVQPPGVRQGG